MMITLRTFMGSEFNDNDGDLPSVRGNCQMRSQRARLLRCCIGRLLGEHVEKPGGAPSDAHVSQRCRQRQERGVACISSWWLHSTRELLLRHSQTFFGAHQAW